MYWTAPARRQATRTTGPAAGILGIIDRRMTWTPLRRLILPLLLLVAAIWLRPHAAALRPVYLTLLDFLPYVTLVLAALLSTYFNHSRRFTASLFLIAVYTVVLFQLQSSLIEPAALMLYSLISVGVPLMMIFLLFVPELGLTNRYGAMTVSSVPLAFVLGWILAFHSTSIPALVHTWMPIRPLAFSVLSSVGWVAFAAALVLSLLVLLRKDSEPAAGLVSVLVFTLVTMVLFDHPKISAVMFSAVGLALMVSEVRNSYDMAFRDELTGLLGRRALNNKLKGLGSRYVIAMLDVDHFKKFNDTYGHDVGDDVLKLVARHIDHVGGGGTAFRYGGEEFSVIFPRQHLEDCAPHLESVRRAIARYHLTLRDAKGRDIPEKVAQGRRGRRKSTRGNNHASVTISIGMAEANDQHRAPEDVIKAADAALYKAKQKGRNCLVY